jgi:two-component system, NtrC family, sensor kinase
MKCPRCQHENRATAKFCEECATPLKALGPDSPHAPSYAEVTSALGESLEQQTATGEILRVISGSPTDIQPVFDAIVRSGAALCHAPDVLILIADGDSLRVVASVGPVAAVVQKSQLLQDGRLPLTRGSVAGRAFIDRCTVHVHDVSAASDDDFPEGKALQRAYGGRGTTLAVPMLRDSVPVGVITLVRDEVSPFTDRQIHLLQSFADQAVIAIENVRLFNETKEALEQQTATAEILRVISSSPTDVQPVFDTIVQSASRLCNGHWAAAMRLDGELIHLVAQHNVNPDVPNLGVVFPCPPTRRLPSSRAIVEGRVVHIPDAEKDIDLAPEVARRARSFLAVPMLRKGAPIGAIVVARPAPGPFPPNHVELLSTFAGQAVIAIENVRLFKELEARNHDLTRALDRETATSEILRVISSSPTDVQPVFDAIARNAVALCGGIAAVVLRLDGEMLHVAGHHAVSPEGVERNEQAYPRRPGRDYPPGRALLDRSVVHVPDLQAASEFAASTARQRGAGSQLAVPLLHDGEAIGVIGLARDAVGPFSPQQIEVLQTFADQAVIAIENVRLFTELQTSNCDLTTALDTQTATSDILRVISQSQTNVQPVFDAIVASAVRLLRANTGVVTRIEGDHLALVAFTSTDDVGDAATRARFPLPLQSEGAHTQAIRDRAPVNIADTETDRRASDALRAIARARGYRSVVAVPLLRHDEAIGSIAVTRREPGGFTDDEIALLQTFADQAVIAIENARLLSELQARTQELTRSVGELQALGEVGRTLSSTLDLETVLQTIVARANELAGTDGGSIYEYDEAAEVFRLRTSSYADPREAESLDAVGRAAPIPTGQGVVSRAAALRRPVQVPDITIEGSYESPIRGPLLQAGYRAILTVPLLLEERVIGALGVARKTAGDFAPEIVRLLTTFATQSALAIQNARLFREIEQKSRELEAASRHKSEFLANMSHELRTPLNAVIGFSEVLSERMFGDLNEKQEEYLKDIHASGQHLLSLINDILDLSKIEAGRMELEVTNFDLPMAIDNALTLVRERAGRRSIALHTTVDERLGQVQADERKIRQVLLNLLSNAIKFTPEGGRIEVGAKSLDGFIEVAVSDTGVGIAPEDQEAVFEEFRQVGTAEKKVEGTGLGLALSRKFIELHGGKIWVTSQVGEGSTFTFTVPVRDECNQS